MLYCSGSMCVGVTVWFGWGGVVSLCRLKHCSAYLYSSIFLMSMFSSMQVVHTLITRIEFK